MNGAVGSTISRSQSCSTIRELASSPGTTITKFRHNIANKALEFIAARMVTVATDLPSQRLFLKHEQNAMFYAPGNVDELAQVLCSLLGRSG